MLPAMHMLPLVGSERMQNVRRLAWAKNTVASSGNLQVPRPSGQESCWASFTGSFATAVTNSLGIVQ